MKSFLASLIFIVAFSATVYGIYQFGKWMDRRDNRHQERVAREARTACGSDRTVGAEAHDKGWWYEITCRKPNGEVYVVVVK